MSYTLVLEKCSSDICLVARVHPSWFAPFQEEIHKTSSACNPLYCPSFTACPCRAAFVPDIWASHGHLPESEIRHCAPSGYPSSALSRLEAHGQCANEFLFRRSESFSNHAHDQRKNAWRFTTKSQPKPEQFCITPYIASWRHSDSIGHRRFQW